MTKEICRHFWGKIPFEDYLELKEGDERPCICDSYNKNRRINFKELKNILLKFNAPCKHLALTCNEA